MDYHIVFSEMIERSLQHVQQVSLTRHPYGQWESLIRRGLSLEGACRWYRDVAGAMADHSLSRAIGLRCEDVVNCPNRDPRLALPIS
jgi:hypothetical protein